MIGSGLNNPRVVQHPTNGGIVFARSVFNSVQAANIQLRTIKEDKMAFITTSLPNNGQTAHFSVSYDDRLSQADGLDRASDLLNHCENDLALISNWFTGISFEYAFPIYVKITDQLEGGLRGASWPCQSDIELWFGYNPTVTIGPGPKPTTGLIRYLLVSEVTEMYMASQRKEWFGPQGIVYWPNEGSMGESLSRFLASEFLTATAISKVIFPGWEVANMWLNDPSRPKLADTASDDIQPDAVTGFGTCFIFYLKDQLNNSIQSIIAAAAPTLGGVYTNLTGKTDGWDSFSQLVNDHYPLDKGRKYFPPLDNVFPVADLTAFAAPRVLSWVANNPNVALLALSHSVQVNVDVMLSSDDPATISVPANVTLSSSAVVNLNVPAQSAAFTPKVVNLTAEYAGKTLTNAITVVRPEELPITPLDIKVYNEDDPCAQLFVEGWSQTFLVSNPDVIRNKKGLAYNWTVSGATAPVTNKPELNIPSLPAAGTEVTITVKLTNALGIHSTGTLKFTTVHEAKSLSEQIRHTKCLLGRIKDINSHIAPWIPIEEGKISLHSEQLVNIEKQAKRLVAAANLLIKSARAVRSSKDAR